jgi:SAM-dependent methyltransferase
MSSKKRKQKTARAARNKQKKIEQTGEAQQFIEDCWRSYAKKWEHHSECFRSGDHYQWMAGFLSNRDRVLEIGTGDGSGTVALFQNGSTLVSIDHNPKCLDIAEARLLEAGIPVRYESRSAIQATKANVRIVYSVPGLTPEQGKVLLTEGDIGHQEEVGLAQWLFSLPKFDAIACWNIGSYAVLVESYATPADYRLGVQQVVYQIAHRILQPGGVLHIVDRLPATPASEHDRIVRELSELHRGIASGTSLFIEPAAISRRSFTLDTSPTGIEMKHRNEFGELAESSDEKDFWSILATKS